MQVTPGMMAGNRQGTSLTSKDRVLCSLFSLHLQAGIPTECINTGLRHRRNNSFGSGHNEHDDGRSVGPRN